MPMPLKTPVHNLGVTAFLTFHSDVLALHPVTLNQYGVTYGPVQVNPQTSVVGQPQVAVNAVGFGWRIKEHKARMQAPGQVQQAIPASVMETSQEVGKVYLEDGPRRVSDKSQDGWLRLQANLF